MALTILMTLSYTQLLAIKLGSEQRSSSKPVAIYAHKSFLNRLRHATATNQTHQKQKKTDENIKKIK